MARLTQNYDTRATLVPFNDVITSENSIGSNGYTGHTGTFIAPIDGIYVFHSHVLKCQKTAAPLFLNLLHNDRMVASATNHDSLFETTSMSAVLSMAKGDAVAVKLRTGVIYGRTANHYSTFSGFYLGPRDANTARKILPNKHRSKYL